MTGSETPLPWLRDPSAGPDPNPATESGAADGSVGEPPGALSRRGFLATGLAATALTAGAGIGTQAAGSGPAYAETGSRVRPGARILPTGARSSVSAGARSGASTGVPTGASTGTSAGWRAGGHASAGGTPPTVGRYAQQVATTVPAPAGLGTVAALAADAHGRLAVTHSGGLAIRESDTWQAIAGLPSGGFGGATWFGGAVVALQAGGLVTVSRSDGGSWRAHVARLPAGVRGDRALLTSGRDLLLAYGSRFWTRHGDGWSARTLPGAARAIAQATDGRIAVALAGSGAASGSGLVESDRTGHWSRVVPRDEREGWQLSRVTLVAYASDGTLWCVGSSGIGVRPEPTGPWSLYDPARGLPSLDLTALAAGPAGDAWFGTGHGAIRFDSDATWEFREGRQWLPGNAISALAVDGAGRATFATDGGLGTITPTSTTLISKAAVFEKAIDERHRRTAYEFINGATLAAPGDLGHVTLGASDNDGLWTGMYGAAECFRYAVDRSAESYRKARKVFEALRFLGDVTQGGAHPAPNGFVARAVIPTTDPDPNLHDSPERDREKQKGDAYWKVIDPRWPTGADGKWYWKSDTSNDELVGHFFFHALYFDLVAKDDAEKAEVAAVITRMADHLIDHGFNLVDHTGTPTRWGFYAPEQLNENPWRREEKGLNSQSILTYLTIADHVSDSARYADAKAELIEKHGYAVNVLWPKVTQGIGGGNQSDDEMAFMNYYHLLAYEKNPALRRTFAKSLYDYWQLERPESNPLFDFVAAVRLTGATWQDAYGSVPLDPTGPWLDQSLDTLRRLTIDRINWRHTNSGRLDLVPLQGFLRPDDDPGKAGVRVDGMAVPIDERSFSYWNHDPYAYDSGGDGTTEADGATFLLPYWMGRHHGLFVDGAA